jgi:hypothetical protein
MRADECVFPVTDASVLENERGVLFGLASNSYGHLSSAYVVPASLVKLVRLADGSRTLADLIAAGQHDLGLEAGQIEQWLRELEGLGVVYGVPSHLLEFRDPLAARSLHGFRGLARRIALVLPPSSVQGLGPTQVSRLSNSAPPLGALWIAAVLEEHGWEVRVFDLCEMFESWEQLFGELELFDPAVVGLSMLSSQVLWGKHLLAKLRDLAPASLLLAGGVHPTVYPDELLDAGADVVIRGEGEYSLLRFLEAVRDGEDVSVPGVAVHGIPCQLAPPVEDLDGLPLPARHLVDILAYGHSGSLLSSRGCPNRCFWCTNIFRTLRQRSVENVVNEMRFLNTKWGINEFQVQDDLFTSDSARVREFCRRIERSGYQWGVHATVADADRDLLLFKTMYATGLRAALFGVESSNLSALKKISKSVSPQRTRELLLKLRDVGIDVTASFILGLPEDTLESIERTREYAVSLLREGIDVVVNVLNAFPGTQLDMYPERFHVRIENRLPNRLAYRCVNLSTDKLSSAQIRDEYAKTLYALARVDDPKISEAITVPDQ